MSVSKWYLFSFAYVAHNTYLYDLLKQFYYIDLYHTAALQPVKTTYKNRFSGL